MTYSLWLESLLNNTYTPSDYTQDFCIDIWCIMSIPQARLVDHILQGDY